MRARSGSTSGRDSARNTSICSAGCEVCRRQEPASQDNGGEPAASWGWRAGHTYIVVEQSPALTAGKHERCRPGLNHLAFHVAMPARLDELTSQAQSCGWRLMFPDPPPPPRGGPHHDASLGKDDGFEVEFVAPMPP